MSKNEKLHPSIGPFLDYLEREKRYPKNTYNAYDEDLSQFFDYLLNNNPDEPDEDLRGLGLGSVELRDLTAGLVRSWLASLKKRKQSAKTINRKISTLKSFFKYHLRTGTIELSPMTNIIAPKIPKRLPNYVEQKDIDTLFTKLPFPDTWKGRTDQLLLAVFYNTGMRLTELIQLKERHVDTARKSLKVLGKGSKERIIPVSADLVTVLDAYMQEKRSALETFDPEFLFVNEQGKKLYPKYVYRVVNSYLQQVTTIEKTSPHVLRHTFATHLANNGADLNAVKELLGHSSLAATQIYTHNTIEKLKDIYKKAHPKA